MIFHKQRFFGWSFWLLLLMSCVLITLDQKKLIVPQIKNFLQSLLLPVAYVINAPSNTVHFLQNYFVSQHTLIRHQKDWQAQQLLLTAKLQELNSLKQQNKALQALFHTASIQPEQTYLLARVIAINTEGHTREILINQGSHAGIKIGQGVVGADGVVGQVIAVTPLSSRVMLLSDPRSAIPVTNVRSEENFIIMGNGNNEALTILDVPNNTNLKVGDMLMSSGIGGHYPPHYPVGSITHLNNQAKTNEWAVHITPATHFNHLHLVLVVFIHNEHNT
jgi:rod shape-determining protein MreC